MRVNLYYNGCGATDTLLITTPDGKLVEIIEDVRSLVEAGCHTKDYEVVSTDFFMSEDAFESLCSLFEGGV